jgi:two-component system OmpR family response regulator
MTNDSPLVLVVEDDLKLGRVLVRGLRDAGFGVDLAPTGAAGLERALSGTADAVVLDIGLPDIDGLELCRRLREHDVLTPVLMLTARSAIADRVTGLEAGADDYLAKPFSLLELTARLRALLRRGERRQAAPLCTGPLKLDPIGRRVWRGAVELHLSPREFDLLEAFMHRPGEAISRDWLLEQAWDVAYEQRSNVVDAYVRLLREKVDRPFDRTLLQTVRGIGYRLDVEG